MKANEIVAEAGKCLVQRGVDYDDDQNGERSMAHAVSIFRAITGSELTVAEGWILMMCVKLARLQQTHIKLDSYVDLAAYVALLGEERTHGK